MHYSDPKPRANEDWLCNKVVFVSVLTIFMTTHFCAGGLNQSITIPTVWCAELQEEREVLQMQRAQIW